jgi:hypothetical protein
MKKSEEWLIVYLTIPASGHLLPGFPLRKICWGRDERKRGGSYRFSVYIIRYSLFVVCCLLLVVCCLLIIVGWVGILCWVGILLLVEANFTPNDKKQITKNK